MVYETERKVFGTVIQTIIDRVILDDIKINVLWDTPCLIDGNQPLRIKSTWYRIVESKPITGPIILFDHLLDEKERLEAMLRY